MTPAEQVKVQINFILNDFVFPQHEIKHNSSFLPCSILGDPNQKNPKWQTIIKPLPPIHPLPGAQSVNHSQRNSQITHSTHSTAATTHTAGDTAQENNHLLILQLQQMTTDASHAAARCFGNTSQFTLNLKQNTSSQSFDFSSSRTFSKQKISYLTSASRRLNRWGPK